MINSDTESGIHRPDPLNPVGSGTSSYGASSPGASNPTGATSGHSESGSTNAGAKAREAAGQVRQETQRLADEAKARGRSLVEDQKRAAAAEIEGMAQALQTTAQQLNEQDQTSTARYVGRAAESLGRMASALRDRDLDSLIRQTEDFARHQPGIFLGGAVVTGFLLSRFLKSSAERREAEYGPAFEGRVAPTVYEPEARAGGPTRAGMNTSYTGEY